MRKTNPLYESILAKQDPSQVEGLMRFFKTGKGQYGEGDQFLGIKVPVTREVVKQCWQKTSFDNLETCIQSEYHEIRLAALLTLVQQFKHAKKDIAVQQRCVDFYLAHTEFINNWDLVDLSCYELLGTWLLDKDRTLLYDLARNGNTIWEQRIGMVSTMQFLRHGELDDTQIVGTFALIPGPDITYNVIYNGQWLDDDPYHVIHRIASTPQSHGILDTVLDFSESIAKNIRIDTHEANIIMRKGLERHGYQYCGIIHLLNGDERMAFQKKV